MAEPAPEKSVYDVQQTFGIMGHSKRNTVALIGGGHAVGKGHGACPKGGGKLPKDAYKDGELPWQGQCGTGKGKDTVTAGFEGAWTSNPLKWDNQYFDDLLNKEWEKHKGPGGHWQWRIKDSDSKLMRLTADLALLHDEEYLKIVKKFASDMDAFNAAFDNAWFDLTTKYGSGTWADNAKCDDGEFPESLRHVELPNVEKYKRHNVMLNSDLSAATEELSYSPNMLAGFFAAAMALSMAVGYGLKHRSEKEARQVIQVTDGEVEHGYSLYQ